MIEIRTFIDPSADKSVVEGIKSGGKRLLDDLRLQAKFLEFNWKYAAAAEEEFAWPDGGLKYYGFIFSLQKEKIDIASGVSDEKPHWDLVVTSRDLNPEANYNYVFGGFFGNFKDNQRLDLASCAISAHRLGHHDPEIAFGRGWITAYHEFSHLVSTYHCDDSRCLFQSGEKGLPELDIIVMDFLRQRESPMCEFHRKTYAAP